MSSKAIEWVVLNNKKTYNKLNLFGLVIRMRKSANSQTPYIQQQSEQQESDEDYESDIEVRKKKKPAAIPRFVKNDIDQIDTNVIVLNISRTQYQVVQQVAKQLGWEVQRSKKSQKWDIMWIDSHIEAHDLFKLNQHQKISHFPAIYVLTRKNFLGRSLMKMRSCFPQQYSFFPSTWSIPADFTQLLRYNENLQKSQQNQFYIYKPQALAQGKGIKLYDNVELLDGKNGIVQQYINNPFLIQNLKFDLRIYVLILGYDPLRIFIYDQGLGRFATEKYQKVQKKNMKDVHMHLTNYAINKNNKNFIFNSSQKDMNKGHKRSLSAIYNYLNSKGVDTTKIKKKIDEMIIKTLIVGQPMIAHTYGLAQADLNSNDLCFQILGFDVLINEKLEPVLLEVNHTPSFKTDTPLDKFIKKSLIKDTLVLLNVNTQNKKQKIDQKKQFIEMRSQRKLTKLSPQQREELRKKKWKERDEYELTHLGNFRKIFPTESSYKYTQMIEMSNKIFNEANGIKNKSTTVSTKLNHSKRPKSFDKNKVVCAEVSPLFENKKQKKLMDLAYGKTQSLRMKGLDEDIPIDKFLRSSKQKFPEIMNPKKLDRQERNRNYSGYMAANVKQQLIKPTFQKLQRTTSYNKKSNLQPLEAELFLKGNYVLPKVLEMGQIGSVGQKSTELPLSSSYSPQTSLNSSPNFVTKTSTIHKIRNFDDVVNEACIQIQSLSPSKMTYQNLLKSLSASNSATYSKQDFIRLKALKKYE